MDTQYIQQVFMTEVMPLVSQGFASGFDCKWMQEIITLGEHKLSAFVSKFGPEWMGDGVVMVVDWMLKMLGVRKDCEAEVLVNYENALY